MPKYNVNDLSHEMEEEDHLIGENGDGKGKQDL